MKKLILFFTLFLVPLVCVPQGTTTGQRAVTIHNESASGTVKRGCRFVMFIFNASFAGTVGNGTFTATSPAVPIPAQAGDILADIPYTVTAGSITIIEER